MAQDQWTLHEKERVKNELAHGPPLQARVVAANRTVRTTRDDPGAHGNEQGAKQSKIERGQTDDEGSGHGMAKVAGKQSRLNRAAAGKHSRRTIRPAQALKNSCRRSGRYRPRSKTTASRHHRPASRRAVQVGGGSTVVLALERRAQTYPACLPPTYRLCLSPSIPTPLICENQFSPNLFFFVLFLFLLHHYNAVS